MAVKIPISLGRGKKPKTTSGSRVKPTREQPDKQKRIMFALLIVAAVVALTMFVIVRVSGQLTIAENTVGTVFSPVQRALSSATIFVRDLVTGAKDYARVTQEAAELKQQLTDTQLMLMQYQADAAETAQLRDLLGAKETYRDLDPVHAQVISKSPSVWSDTFSINIGTNDGVQKNNAVINGDGLIGRVYEVGATYAKVMTIINEDSSVGCLIERTRDTGVMYGPVSRNTDVIECEMRWLGQIDAVVPRDVVVTSGMDKVYPKGLKVGTVTQVSRLQSDTSDRFVNVQPSVDFLRIEHVLVLRVVVEQDQSEYVPLLTPVPTETPVATTRPTPTPDPNAVVPGLDEPFPYPDATLNDEGELVQNPSGAGQNAGNGGTNITFIENEWAR